MKLRYFILFLTLVVGLSAAQLAKTVNGLAIASVKTDEDLVIASVKTIAGLDNTSASAPVFVGAFTLEQTAAASITITGANNNITGSNRCVYVVISGQNASVGASVIVRNTSTTPQSFIKIQSQVTSGAQRMELWRLINPEAGSFNIVATIDASNRTAMTAVWFSGVNQTTSESGIATSGGTTGNGSSAAIVSAAGELVFAFFEGGNAPWAVTGPAVQRYNVGTPNQWDTVGADAAGAASVTIAFTKSAGNRDWQTIGLSIKP